MIKTAKTNGGAEAEHFVYTVRGPVGPLELKKKRKTINVQGKIVH